MWKKEGKWWRISSFFSRGSEEVFYCMSLKFQWLEPRYIVTVSFKGGWEFQSLVGSSGCVMKLCYHGRREAFMSKMSCPITFMKMDVLAKALKLCTPFYLWSISCETSFPVKCATQIARAVQRPPGGFALIEDMRIYVLEITEGFVRTVSFRAPELWNAKSTIVYWCQLLTPGLGRWSPRRLGCVTFALYCFREYSGLPPEVCKG